MNYCHLCAGSPLSHDHAPSAGAATRTRAPPHVQNPCGGLRVRGALLRLRGVPDPSRAPVDEVEGETGGGDRGLDGVHVDVVENGGVESRNPEAHESKLDDGLAGMSKHHLRPLSSTAIAVFVATQYSAAVRTGRIALAVVRPAWKPGLHSPRTLRRSSRVVCGRRRCQ